jgi:hypothetical protein
MKILNKYIGAIVLVVTCCIALLIYDEYGIGWDELQQHRMGEINYNYVFKGDQSLFRFEDRDYGVAFELPLMIIENVLKLNDSREVFLMRHLVTHLLFIVSAFFCFLLVDFLYKNKLLATISFLLIVLSPRLFAQSFFNSKDIPFMSMFLICFFLIAIAFNKKNNIRFILSGISVGLLINIRIAGVILLCCVLLSLIIDFFLSKGDKKLRQQNIHLILLFFTITLATIIICWPFLWTNPFGHFAFAFKNMAVFRWDGNVLFNGDYVNVRNLDWYYSIVWFTITTPIVYLLAGFWGIILFIVKFSKRPIQYLHNTKERNNIYYSICFLVPIAAVIILKSVIYDGWRQLYFIYPSFVLLAIYGLNFLFKTRLKYVVISILFLAFSLSTYFMVYNFPFQQVYFNQIVDHNPPEHLRKNFEMDYWGVSYKQSLEYILKYDKSDTISIAIENYPGYANNMILPLKERKRLKYVDLKNAKYFITNYRWHPQDYEDFVQYKWYSIKVLNNSINTIFKLR